MTNKQQASHANWATVDQTEDPEFFVRFLAGSRATVVQAAEAQPEAFFAYLDVHDGQTVLDAACGLGDMTRILARLVGPSGRVFGVDNSETMIREARARTQGTDAPVDFLLGDIQALDLPDASFDRVRAEQVLQHVADPRRAVTELARVTRPGGRVVVIEPDWDTLIVDAEDLTTSRAFTAFTSDRVVRQGQIGRKLQNLFSEAGLAEISVFPQGIVAGYSATGEFVESTMALAIAEGAIQETAASAWLEDLRTRAADGRYFVSFLLFRVSGTVQHPD